MGLFDSFRNVLRGSGRETLPVELAEGERERGRFVAAKLAGNVAAVGGDLVVTDRRVVFAPLNVTDVVQVLSWGLAKAGAPSGAEKLPIKVGELVGQPSDAGQLTTAEAGRPATLTRPPEVILADDKGNKVPFGVLAGRTKLNRDPANTVARNQLVALVNEAP